MQKLLAPYSNLSGAQRELIATGNRQQLLPLLDNNAVRQEFARYDLEYDQVRRWVYRATPLNGQRSERSKFSLPNPTPTPAAHSRYATPASWQPQATKQSVNELLMGATRAGPSQQDSVPSYIKRDLRIAPGLLLRLDKFRKDLLKNVQHNAGRGGVKLEYLIPGSLKLTKEPTDVMPLSVIVWLPHLFDAGVAADRAEGVAESTAAGYRPTCPSCHSCQRQEFKQYQLSCSSE